MSGIIERIKLIPEAAAYLSALSYAESPDWTEWQKHSPHSPAFEAAINGGGLISLWKNYLDKKLDLPAPALLIILITIRRSPAQFHSECKALGMEFSKTLVYVSFHVATKIYDDARSSFARNEIDVAVARFRFSISEFRFSIESNIISSISARYASGKYAAAIAMIGRWVAIDVESIRRAMEYSDQSLSLGNNGLETLSYRLELQVMHHDKTGDIASLYRTDELLETYKAYCYGSELVRSEICFRYARYAKDLSLDPSKFILSAQKLLDISLSKDVRSLERAHAVVLSALIKLSAEGTWLLPSGLCSIPRGLLAQMATNPSKGLWQGVRKILTGLDILRKEGSIPAAVLMSRLLRQIVEGPHNLMNKKDAALYVDAVRWLERNASKNRHLIWEAGAAVLSVSKRTMDRTLASTAQDRFSTLAAVYPEWPLPRIGLARYNDYFGKKSGSSTEWKRAAALALMQPKQYRSNLGGRNEVFFVADARGFLSETFVFKRTQKEKAEHEASMLELMRSYIEENDLSGRFEVPRSLAIVELPSEDERTWVHVTQRSPGRLLSSLRPSEASSYIPEIIRFLSIYHSIGGKPAPGKAGWQPLKPSIKMWSKSLFPHDNGNGFLQSLKDIFPSNIPIVRKRDAHSSNWMIDPAGRIVAIDFESVEFIPAGYDVAQLIEDDALIVADAPGWTKRIDYFCEYMRLIGYEIDYSVATEAYEWFSACRVLRLGTDKAAGKRLRRHAREVCSMLIDHGSNKIRPIARDLLQAISQVEHDDAGTPSIGRHHRNLSKTLSSILRHNAKKFGIAMDSEGFCSINELAKYINVEPAMIRAVAEHPAEPRFQIKADTIRALYGHSLDVEIDPELSFDRPSTLYHGSNWGAVDSIIEKGLIPMERRKVHLASMPMEAISVGSRKGAVVLFSISDPDDLEGVAEGLWLSPHIQPEKLSIENIYEGESIFY